MSPRAIRRAAERQALRQTDPSSIPQSKNYFDLSAHMDESLRAAAEKKRAEISAAQLAANRANALLSTGPVTEAGKRIARYNAVKTGLTGRTVLLPSDDADAYAEHIANFESAYKPATPAERALVQSLADTRWRANRIPTLEAGIFLRGRLQFADKYAAHQPHLAAALVDAETLLTYEKQLRNLHIQEARLNRTFAKELAELKALQAERRKAEEEAKSPAPRPQPRPEEQPKTAAAATDSHENGFVFSTHELQR